MSKYDGIKTASELALEVRFHGLSTAQEDICRAQDIFGNSTVEELVALANDIGRNNDQGEPDPKGSWSSSRQPTQSTFYMIASCIWNWEEVTRFWNQHTNPEHEELLELRKQVKGLEAQVKHYDEQLKQEHQNCLDERAEKTKLKEEIRKLGADLHDEKMTTMELKSKLYDLMVAQERRNDNG